jgi:CPA2 family monovalent cation:H+ antiporter-2
MERSALESVHGRVAVGWLIVEDLFTVLVLVLLPTLALALGGQVPSSPSPGDLSAQPVLALGLALGKVALLTVLVLVIGPRTIPWLLGQVANTGSRELFTLAVLAVALGIAFGSALGFGVSLALGAFLAGVVVSESDLGHQAAADALPFRDAFAVLFFVSVGMLFDPRFLVAAPGPVLAVLALIVLGKGLAALAIVAALGHPLRTGLIVGAGLAQIGEFSFIVAELGRSLRLLPDEGYNLVVAGALLSITLNPLVFRAVDPLEAWLRRHPRLTAVLERRAVARAQPMAGAHGDHLRGHAVICGYGQVGRVIAQALDRRGLKYVVVELDRRRVQELRLRGVAALYGDAANPVLLEHTNLADAHALVVTIPDPPATRHVVQHARQVNPRLDVVARTHSIAEAEVLLRRGADEAVVGELELALEMTRHTLRRFGVSALETLAIVQGLREEAERGSRDARLSRAD